MKIAKAFDELVADYSEKIMRWVPNYKQLLESIFHFLPAAFNPKATLELGCGNGNLSTLLFHYFPKTQLTAVDISADMLQTVAKRVEGQSVKLDCQLIQDCQYPTESFDFVIAALALHHLDAKEKQQLFKDVHTWLKPGGVFCISDLCIDKKDRPYHDSHLKFWHTHSGQLGSNSDDWDYLMEHYAEFDQPDDWIAQLAWLREAGFKSVETPYRKLGWTSIRARKI